MPPTTSPSPYSNGSGGVGAAASAYENISPTKGHLNLSEYSAELRAASFTQLFHTTSSLATTSSSTTTTVDNSSGDGGGGGDSGSAAASLDDLYVIALSTESDELVVWSIYEDRAVRTLKGIPRPRDLHVVDCGGEGGGSGSGCPLRAVVLCNRELMLYDLNGGALLTKLKGVMNQKMPYYGLHSEHYVVALSRNRMYVNMINLGTGVSTVLNCFLVNPIRLNFSIYLGLGDDVQGGRGPLPQQSAHLCQWEDLRVRRRDAEALSAARLGPVSKKAAVRPANTSSRVSHPPLRHQQ